MPEEKAVTAIDPSAVFVSEDGEVKLFPRGAGWARVAELNRLTSAEERRQTRVPDSLAVHTTRYHALREAVLDEWAQTVVLRLLAERQEQDDLLDRAHEALEDLIHCSAGAHFCKPDTFQIAHELADRDWRRKHDA